MDGVTASISSQARHGALSMSRLLRERHSACSGIETCRILGSRVSPIHSQQAQQRRSWTSRPDAEVMR